MEFCYSKYSRTLPVQIKDSSNNYSMVIGLAAGSLEGHCRGLLQRTRILV